MKYKNENMDCLNDRLKKKDLGAFYTPKPYCKKAAELVKMAVDRVPDGNDYIILDRCAGTGNLEEALEGIYDKNGSELISHCIVSTYEYYEYRVLFERLLGKVREIIPPSEENVIYSNGMVSNADAMSKEFIDNPIIKQYLDNPKCNVILFENPPFRDSSSANKKRDRNSLTRKSYVFSKMSQIKNTFRNKNISTVRDITNQFIWSGFKYYLRKIDDSYVLFSPCKWWKECGIADYMFLKGYLFNRKYFHASTSAVMCSVWSNVNDSKTESIFLYSVPEIKDTTEVEIIKVNKCYSTFSRFYKKSIDGIQTNVFCESSGYETKGRKCCGKSIYSDDIIAYLTTKGFSLDANNNNLVRMTHYNNRGTYMTKKNYLYFLPLFVAKSYPKGKYYEKGECCIYFTSSDGGDKYTKDKEFLKNCLIYTCLSNQNKCLSFIGSDGRYYKNNLCFDNDTIASNELKHTKLDLDEKELINLWDKIINEARKTENYNDSYTYGIYQINKELNTFDISGIGKWRQRIYDYPELNGLLNILKIKLKKYYKSHITDKMFKYELLK